MAEKFLPEPSAPHAAVCAALPRDFTPAEREQYDIRDEKPTCRPGREARAT